MNGDLLKETGEQIAAVRRDRMQLPGLVALRHHGAMPRSAY